MTMRILSAGGVAVLLAGIALAAQQRPGQPRPIPRPVEQPPVEQPQMPTFRVTVDAIEIEAFVIDEQGKPVAGLKREDFEILEDGKSQDITSFSQVDIPFERRADTRALSAATDPDVIANDHSDGRVYMFVLDEMAPEVALRSRVFLKRFLERHFAANDRGAVVFLGRQNSTAGQTFTNDARLLLAAVERFTGGFGVEKAPSAPAVEDPNAPGAQPLSPAQALVQGRLQAAGKKRIESYNAARQAETSITSLGTMSGLEGAVTAIARLHGRRKSVLLFSTGLPEPIFRALTYDGGALTKAEQAAHAAVTAATRGSVTVYAVDPAGLTIDLDAGTSDAPEHDVLSDDPVVNGRDASDKRLSLSMLADATGGFSLVNSNGFNAAFDRIVRENSTYYLLGYTSSNDRRDGRHRSLRVRVTRPDLNVRARDGYIAPFKNERAPEPAHIASLSPSLSSALTNALPDDTVPIRMVAAPFRREGRNATVAITAEIDPASLALSDSGGVHKGQLEVGFIATDMRSTIYPGEHYTVDLALKADTYEMARQQRGLRVAAEMELPPGRYQLRFAAGNTAGRAGNVVYELAVPDFHKDPLMLSGLAVTSVSTSVAATLAPKDPLKGLLPRPATAKREFEPSDTIGIFGEVYDNVSPPSSIDVLLDMRTPDGRLVRTEAVHTNRFLIQLPLAGIPPGEYVLHVNARTTSGAPRSAVRDLSIRVR
jgi:VWFA-related protein